MKAAIEEKWLRQKYIQEEYSLLDLADMLHKDKETIRYWLKKYDIPRRGPECNLTQRTREKRRIHLLGKKQSPETIEKRTSQLRLENHPNWKGGIKKMGGGYLYLRSPNYPFANNHGYVAMHRLIAEKALGRYLKKHEVVHHLNENITDNRNNNLVVCDNKYHQFLHMRMKRLAGESLPDKE